MTTHDFIPPANTDAETWANARLGKATASRIADVVRRTKSGWSTARHNYRMELIAERLTGMAKEVYVSDAMRWGQETEKDAVARYMASTHSVVSAPAWLFVSHPTIAMAGCSPDGLVGSDGLVQVKCPETKTHIATLLDKEVDEDYVKQCQWELACTGRKWNDLISYDPRVPKPIRLYRYRIERDDLIIAGLEEMVRQFLTEIDEAIKSLGSFELPEVAPVVPPTEPVMGWSDSLPEKDFSSLDTLMKSGVVKKGMSPVIVKPRT